MRYTMLLSTLEVTLLKRFTETHLPLQGLGRAFDCWSHLPRLLSLSWEMRGGEFWSIDGFTREAVDDFLGEAVKALVVVQHLVGDVRPLISPPYLPWFRG